MPFRLIKFIVPGERAMEWLTNAIAAAGIATWFTPELYQWTAGVSQGAALMMPILGCMWLAVQIWSKVVRGK